MYFKIMDIENLHQRAHRAAEDLTKLAELMADLDKLSGDETRNMPYLFNRNYLEDMNNILDLRDELQNLLVPELAGRLPNRSS